MNNRQTLRETLHEIIFESHTPAGRAFDVALLVLIVSSVICVMLESVPSVQRDYGALFRQVEWGFTVLFTLEYVLRLVSVRQPLRYVTSFFGIVDLLAILPAYLSIFVVGTHQLMAIRILRLMRVFRIFKLNHYTRASVILTHSLRESREKITVFFLAVITLVVLLGVLMYVVEGGTNGFESIPLSIYWAVITLTTVGYGDIVPNTALGKMIATFVMILGYAIIAVPTGIVSVSLADASRKANNAQVCGNCGREGHDLDARHCKYCGDKL